MIGNVISSYKIMAKLGEGAMGTVYKGLDFMLDREVAIKVLRPELARYPELVERFRAEAVTLAKLHHANIATLYNFLRQGDDYFMVMEYVPGETLDALLRRCGALPSQQAVALFAQALEGIARAHKMGIIHRDIKPANVMLTPAGEVKVMDFGIAKALNSAQRLTREGRLVGTVEYMSPEQIHGEALDTRSDIYSLGVLLYELLTGRAPFSSTSEFAIMQAHVSAAPLPPRELVPSIPQAVERALLQALAKEPAQRFETAEAFRTALLGPMLGPMPGADLATHPLAPPPILRQPPPPPVDPPVVTPMLVTPSVATPLPVAPPTPLPPTEPKETRMAPPHTPIAPLPAQQMKETRMAAAGAPPQVVYPIPVGNPGTQAAARLSRTEEEPRARLNWKHYAAGGAAAFILLSIIAVAVVSSLIKQSTPTPSPTVAPQPITSAPATPEPAPPDNASLKEAKSAPVDKGGEKATPKPPAKPPRKKRTTNSPTRPRIINQ